MVEKKTKKSTFSKQDSFETKVQIVLEKQGDGDPNEGFVYEEDLWHTGPPPAKAGPKRAKFQNRTHALSDGNQPLLNPNRSAIFHRRRKRLVPVKKLPVLHLPLRARLDFRCSGCSAFPARGMPALVFRVLGLNLLVSFS
jgi:hypothetical protein